MHEAGLMQTALDMACAEARRAGGRGIGRIVLRVGAASGVAPDALRFAFDALAPGTAADGASLEVEEVSARCHCPNCGRDFNPGEAGYECPGCGMIVLRATQGTELELARVEVLL